MTNSEKLQKYTTALKSARIDSHKLNHTWPLSAEQRHALNLANKEIKVMEMLIAETLEQMAAGQ
jgi:hypothetical protein